VLLASALSDRLGGHGGGLGAASGLTSQARHAIAPKMADAFGHTFWWALALLAVAFLGSLALPKRKPAVAPGDAPVPVMA
jgi:hypothetical protein